MERWWKFKKMEILTKSTEKQSINNVTIGEGVKIFDFVNLYGCEIGDNSKIGTFVEIQRGSVIGANCKVSSHSFICEGVHIEDNVFIGHSVSFVNDMIPRAAKEDGTLLTDDDWTLVETFVKKGASIGTGSTILGGITINENALIGAGTVVTKDVPANAVVVGNPGKIIKYLK
jgi:acetyltransferase-like isoleucine patch superfamily enzyme